MRDTPEERYDEEWQQDHEVKPIKGIDLRGTLETIWRMYRRQKADEAAAGREVDEEVVRMREVFVMGLKGELTDDEIERRYPEARDRSNPLVCHICNDTGWYYSPRCRSTIHGHPVESPGMRACSCPHGDAKNRAIAAHGKKPERRKSL